MNAINMLESVLCDPDGKCCIVGSAADRKIVDDAIAELRSAIAQPVQQAETTQAGAMKSDLVYVYWSGYTSGHHHTVEGHYTDVTHHYARSHHAEVVDDLISDGSIAQPEQTAEPVAWMTEDGRVASNATKQMSMASPSKAAFDTPLYLSCSIAQPVQPKEPK